MTGTSGISYLVETTCISIEKDTHGFCENSSSILLCQCALSALYGFPKERKRDVGAITRGDGRCRVSCAQEVNIGEETRDEKERGLNQDRIRLAQVSESLRTASRFSFRRLVTSSTRG